MKTGSFETQEFLLTAEKIPEEKEVLRELLVYAKGTKWEQIIMERIGEIENKKYCFLLILAVLCSGCVSSKEFEGKLDGLEKDILLVGSVELSPALREGEQKDPGQPYRDFGKMIQ